MFLGTRLCFCGQDHVSAGKTMFPRTRLCFSGQDYVSPDNAMFPRTTLCFPGQRYVSPDNAMFPRTTLCFPDNAMFPQTTLCFPGQRLCFPGQRYVSPDNAMFLRHAKKYGESSTWRISRLLVLLALGLSPPASDIIRIYEEFLYGADAGLSGRNGSFSFFFSNQPDRRERFGLNLLAAFEIHTATS